MLCEKINCFGCTACSAICPTQSIQMEADEEGFLRPVINIDTCIHCGLCEKACAALEKPNVIRLQTPKVYACWTKDEEIRKESTSGGLFTALASSVLSRGGTVFGAAYDADMNVVHTGISNASELYRLRGSKYVQSELGTVYTQIKTLLSAGTPVLFSGTPCQTAGLYKFLGNEPEHLITCDLVCHGVPSPKIYREWLTYMKKKFKSGIADYKFRDKKTGWIIFSEKIIFKNKRVYLKNAWEDPYFVGFLRDLFSRPSCHSCAYANTDRISDITIADFWGYQSEGTEDIDENRGVSLAMINSTKGLKLFDTCRNTLFCFERSLAEAVAGNRCLRDPFPPSEQREAFWADYKAHGFEYVIKQYLYPKKMSFKEKIMLSLDAQTVRNYKKIKNNITKLLK